MQIVKVARGPTLVTACQIRMSRAALGWTIQLLAQKSGVGEKTIRTIEAQNGIPNVRTTTLQLLQTTFEDHGILFILAGEGPEEGPGIRFNDHSKRGSVPSTAKSPK